MTPREKSEGATESEQVGKDNRKNADGDSLQPAESSAPLHSTSSFVSQLRQTAYTHLVNDSNLSSNRYFDIEEERLIHCSGWSSPYSTSAIMAGDKSQPHDKKRKRFDNARQQFGSRNKGKELGRGSWRLVLVRLFWSRALS